MINQMGTNHGVKLGCTYGNTLTNPEGITIIDHYWNLILNNCTIQYMAYNSMVCLWGYNQQMPCKHGGA